MRTSHSDNKAKDNLTFTARVKAQFGFKSLPGPRSQSKSVIGDESLSANLMNEKAYSSQFDFSNPISQRSQILSCAFSEDISSRTQSEGFAPRSRGESANSDISIKTGASVDSPFLKRKLLFHSLSDIDPDNQLYFRSRFSPVPKTNLTVVTDFPKIHRSQNDLYKSILNFLLEKRDLFHSEIQIYDVLISQFTDLSSENSLGFLNYLFDIYIKDERNDENTSFCLKFILILNKNFLDSSNLNIKNKRAEINIFIDMLEDIKNYFYSTISSSVTFDSFNKFINFITIHYVNNDYKLKKIFYFILSKQIKDYQQLDDFCRELFKNSKGMSIVEELIFKIIKENIHSHVPSVLVLNILSIFLEAILAQIQTDPFHSYKPFLTKKKLIYYNDLINLFLKNDANEIRSYLETKSFNSNFIQKHSYLFNNFNQGALITGFLVLSNTGCCAPVLSLLATEPSSFADKQFQASFAAFCYFGAGIFKASWISSRTRPVENFKDHLLKLLPSRQNKNYNIPPILERRLSLLENSANQSFVKPNNFHKRVRSLTRLQDLEFGLKEESHVSPIQDVLHISNIDLLECNVSTFFFYFHKIIHFSSKNKETKSDLVLGLIYAIKNQKNLGSSLKSYLSSCLLNYIKVGNVGAGPLALFFKNENTFKQDAVISVLSYQCFNLIRIKELLNPHLSNIFIGTISWASFGASVYLTKVTSFFRIPIRSNPLVNKFIDELDKLQMHFEEENLSSEINSDNISLIIVKLINVISSSPKNSLSLNQEIYLNNGRSSSLAVFFDYLKSENTDGDCSAFLNEYHQSNEPLLFSLLNKLKPSDVIILLKKYYINIENISHEINNLYPEMNIEGEKLNAPEIDKLWRFFFKEFNNANRSNTNLTNDDILFASFKSFGYILNLKDKLGQEVETINKCIQEMLKLINSSENINSPFHSLRRLTPLVSCLIILPLRFVFAGQWGYSVNLLQSISQEWNEDGNWVSEYLAKDSFFTIGCALLTISCALRVGLSAATDNFEYLKIAHYNKFLEGLVSKIGLSSSTSSILSAFPDESESKKIRDKLIAALSNDTSSESLDKFINDLKTLIENAGRNDEYYIVSLNESKNKIETLENIIYNIIGPPENYWMDKDFFILNICRIIEIILKSDLDKTTACQVLQSLKDSIKHGDSNFKLAKLHEHPKELKNYNSIWLWGAVAAVGNIISFTLKTYLPSQLFKTLNPVLIVSELLNTSSQTFADLGVTRSSVPTFELEGKSLDALNRSIENATAVILNRA